MMVKEMYVKCTLPCFCPHTRDYIHFTYVYGLDLLFFSAFNIPLSGLVWIQVQYCNTANNELCVNNSRHFV